MPRESPPLPAPARRALRKLGSDIRDARVRRRLTAAIIAERARIDPATLRRIEHGMPGASLGALATVLFVLGLADRLADVADASSDSVGRALDDERLPKRVRMPRPKEPDQP
jgi:transcriptional regulator with XRE-family HTH domain